MRVTGSTVKKIVMAALRGPEDDFNGDDSPSNDMKLLRFHRKVAYAAGNFITVLAISVWFPYNVTFFQKVIGLTPNNAGYIVLFGQIGGAISTPFIGMWSDQCLCRIPGRRKVFHLLGVICVTCVFFFIWNKCLSCNDDPQFYKVLYFSSFAIVFQFGWASTQLGQLSLLPELCREKKTQVELNSMRYMQQYFMHFWLIQFTVDTVFGYSFWLQFLASSICLLVVIVHRCLLSLDGDS